MDQVFFRLHVRFIAAVHRTLSPKVLFFFEFLFFLVACSGLAALFFLHRSFQDIDSQANVIEQALQQQGVSLADVDVLYVHLSPSKEEVWHLDEAEQPYCFQPSSCELSGDLAAEFEQYVQQKNSWHYDEDFVRLGVPYTSSRAKGDLFLRQRLYAFSFQKAYLNLPRELHAKKHIRTHKIHLFATELVPSPFLRPLLHHILGFDEVIGNYLSNLALHAASQRMAGSSSKAFLYTLHTGQLRHLSASHSPTTTNSPSSVTTDHHHQGQAPSHFQQSRWLFKLGIFLTSVFLFFTTTTLVSFTLKETQQKMIHFTFALQHHVRHGLPYAGLVFSHVIESLVFVPIMVGILFFLFEFFSDQLTAFVLLSLVWVCEVFSIVSLRSHTSILFFPRVVFLYFSLFHFYFFVFPNGFSHLAILTTCLFAIHAMAFFWNHCEVPALSSGTISPSHPRRVASSSPSATIPSLSSLLTSPPPSLQEDTDNNRIVGLSLESTRRRVEESRRIQQLQMVSLARIQTIMRGGEEEEQNNSSSVNATHTSVHGSNHSTPRSTTTTTSTTQQPQWSSSLNEGVYLAAFDDDDSSSSSSDLQDKEDILLEHFHTWETEHSRTAGEPGAYLNQIDVQFGLRALNQAMAALGRVDHVLRRGSERVRIHRARGRVNSEPDPNRWMAESSSTSRYDEDEDEEDDHSYEELSSFEPSALDFGQSQTQQPSSARRRADSGFASVSDPKYPFVWDRRRSRDELLLPSSSSSRLDRLPRNASFNKSPLLHVPSVDDFGYRKSDFNVFGHELSETERRAQEEEEEEEREGMVNLG